MLLFPSMVYLLCVACFQKVAEMSETDIFNLLSVDCTVQYTYTVLHIGKQMAANYGSVDISRVETQSFLAQSRSNFDTIFCKISYNIL